MVATSPIPQVEHQPLTPEERERRKQAKREAKAFKKAQREKTRIHNKMRLDHRPEVRMTALLETMDGKETDNEGQEAERNVKLSNAAEAADRVVSLMDMSLSTFSLSLLSQYPPSSVLELDVSHNNLAELPGLSALVNLTTLNIRRNEFRSLPTDLVHLRQLSCLNASRNQLRPSADLLVLLKQMSNSLQSLDLTFNKKLFTQDLLDLLTKALPSVQIDMTVTFPPPSGAYVGTSAADRNPELLRSQMEAYTTLQLRKRLVEVFGHAPYDNYGQAPEGRAHVMDLMLKEYEQRLGSGLQRKLVRSLGVPVPEAALQGVHRELEAWAQGFDDQERPMIAASKYMILRSPNEAHDKRTRLGSRRAQSALKKFAPFESLWKAAQAALATVDPDFADTFTGLAITLGFRGSPHIDTTNTGPFYGLSVGDFADGTGGIRVELDPFTVCEVNTKNRLGRVDGRFPHWVAPYDSEKTRYSLIFYRTEGVVQPVTTAVFGDIIMEEEDGA